MNDKDNIKSAKVDQKTETKEAPKYPFPTEMVDLPSAGKLYSEDNPFSSGQIDIKYMTTKEEDILTSQNLIKKGIVIERLLESLIMTPGIDINDLCLGDKNAVMVAARILAYGAEYTVEANHPTSGEKQKITFDLSECPFKELPSDVDYSQNTFEFELPICKKMITFKILNGHDDKLIEKEIKSTMKLNKFGASPEVSTRLKHALLSVEGNNSKGVVYEFVNNMLARDSLALRDEIARLAPDIILQQEIEWDGGETVDVDIPLAVNFFWPNSQR
jgi:hypothetical protein